MNSGLGSGKIDIRTLAKVMGCSVNYIEKHYDSAIVEDMTVYITRGINVQPPVFGPPFKLVSGDTFSAPSAVLPKVQEVDNSELNVV